MKVTKKGLAIFMTVGLVPLFICLIGLFPYGFNIVTEVKQTHGQDAGLILPPCLTIVTYLSLLVCFYFDLLFKSHNVLIISALHVVGSLFFLAVGASLSYATSSVMSQMMGFGIGGLMLCGVVGLSLWPLTYSIKDLSLGMRKSYRLIAVYVMISVSVVIYLIYIVGVITFTVGMIKNLNHHNEYPDEYNDPAERSFYLVPLYIIVAAFPALVASIMIYKTWEKKVAGYLITPTSCLLLVTIGYSLMDTSLLLKVFNINDLIPGFIKEQPLYAGRAIVLSGLSAMALFVLFILLVWTYLLSKYPNITEEDSINQRVEQENDLYTSMEAEDDDLLVP